MTLIKCLRVGLPALVLLGATVAVSPAQQTPWPDRSGPSLNGDAGEDPSIPLEWSEETGRNIAWKTPIRGAGHSTPVIGESRVWLTSADPDGKRMWVVCLDAHSGNVTFEKLLFENSDPEPLNNPVNTYASPSCVLEPGAVYVHFGSYGTAKLDSQSGEVLWSRRDLPCRHFRGPGSSPVLTGKLLVLTFDGVDQQYLAALDKRTGKTIWRTDRSTDYGDLDEDGKPKRDGDLRKAYSTPGVVDVGGKQQIVSVGSRAAFGYDAETGKELWTIRHDDFNAAARPLFLDDLAIINTGSSKANLLAVRLGADTRGDVTDSRVVWDRPRGNSRLASPVLHEGRVFMVGEKGVVVCVDARTGEEIWKGRVSGNYVASPVVVNHRLHVFNEEGLVTVIDARASAFRTLARNKIAEGQRASPAIAHGGLYLRTFGHLYRIAKPPQ